MMRTLALRLGFTLAALGVLGTTALPASTQSKKLEIERFNTEVSVAESGRVHVSELIRLGFAGSWNGVLRDIPVAYRTPSGFNMRLEVDAHSVTTEDGTALEYEESRQSHYKRIKVWVPGAENVTRTINIR